MVDTFSKTERSRIMSRVKSKNNKSTELGFISIIKEKNIIGWRRNYPLIGKPDFVFPKQRIAIFIDGCFWHKCPKHCRMPSGKSAPCRHPIPVQVGTLIRNMPAGDSGASRQVFCDLAE
jgi:DNA mismatch endonuclease Vsr